MQTTPDTLLLKQICEIRHDLHQHPELGFEEKRTSQVVADYLQSCEGIKVYRGFGKTG